ncbi:ComEA family DNA-binding protein [Psychrobacter sp. NG25]|uniref:ComEA family DNA-binding protein n=1 Tax=Psychrobacter sp. NG25 TaxID=2782005 RepID=UPI0018841308|nr:ComEA family DNA-binding protein [Psychrobacter sp. NG25]MBF0657461.1 ComEA family DNA-binding protein [Psychrobacter sp. NG25]
MNAHPKISFASVVKTAILGCVLAILILNNANAAPCFDNPQSAYEYLLSQENAKTQAREQYTMNINRASEGELVSLNGIGSSKAQAIILYREMFGNFKTVDELAKVKGIGAKTVEKNRGRLSVQD